MMNLSCVKCATVYDHSDSSNHFYLWEHCFFFFIITVNFLCVLEFKNLDEAFFFLCLFLARPLTQTLLHTGVCKFGGAHMAHKAKDRVTNQEFPSCHSWERTRGQKLRIISASLLREDKAKGSYKIHTYISIFFFFLVQILINPQVSGRAEDFVLENKKKLFLCHYESGPIQLCMMASSRNFDGISGAQQENTVHEQTCDCRVLVLWLFLCWDCCRWTLFFWLLSFSMA